MLVALSKIQTFVFSWTPLIYIYISDIPTLCIQEQLSRQVSHCFDFLPSLQLFLQASAPPLQYLHCEHRPAVFPKQRAQRPHCRHPSQEARQEVQVAEEQEKGFTFFLS